MIANFFTRAPMFWVFSLKISRLKLKFQNYKCKLNSNKHFVFRKRNFKAEIVELKTGNLVLKYAILKMKIQNSDC